eukprot:EC721614.1.p1 GENE.EC721614.1~~EC721614.1.p1  ORF type:complete len:60 (+),score=5.32 EC721614.1:25-204(+)
MKGCTFCGAQVTNKVECGICGKKACKACEPKVMIKAGGGASCKAHNPQWKDTAPTAGPQ